MTFLLRHHGFTASEQIQILKESKLRLGFSRFFACPFSSFLIFLLQLSTFYWDCFQFKNARESIIKTGTSNNGVSIASVVKGNFAPSFSLNFLSIFMHNISLEILFPLADLEYSIGDASFG